MSSLQKFHRRTQPFKVNALHTGTVSISGAAYVADVLTATNNIADVDGLGTFAYQWNRSGTAISGATGTTYTLVSADVGNTITVTITYTDGKGFTETETSAATASVINPPNDLVTVSSSVAGVGGGDGDATKGFVLGSFSDGQKMYVAPKSTEVQVAWGSSGTVRGTTFINNGLANTNTLAGFGQAAHTAAYAAKNLTTGGYNTWYLPAKNELNTMYSNKSATPFATANSFVGSNYWSSTEYNGSRAWGQYLSSGGQGYANKDGSYYVRAVRRSTI